MDLKGRTITLYGRFSPGVSDRLRREIADQGGRALRDLTRRADTLVIGALATSLIASGALPLRLKTARARGAPILGERSFVAELDGTPEPLPPTLPIVNAIGDTGLTRGDVELLAAFDLISVCGEACRFGDAGVIRTAADLVARGRSFADSVRILLQARDLAPLGRHKITLTPAGEAALEWQDGRLTTLEGQGYLPLDEDHATLDDLFERAALAEADGDLDLAAALYDQCARADRSDAIAPYNLANIRLAQGAYDAASLAYQQALARDPGLVEARYNLAKALEAAGKLDDAASELARVLDCDPLHADALFNLAQLTMKAGALDAARALFERYLALDPPSEWAVVARKAILVCAAARFSA